MKIAIISDIHGNLDALNSVYADVRQNDVDNLVCLGDMVGYDIQKTADRIIKLGFPKYNAQRLFSKMDGFDS